MRKVCYTGAISKNNFGTDMKIIQELPKGKCIIEFQDEHKLHKEINNTNFSNGNVKNPYDKTLYGIGYIGVGKYKVSGNDKSPVSIAYKFWFSLMERCYSEKRRWKYSAYDDKYMSEKWYNFQDFGAWLDDNYYEIKGEVMQLDKDILVKGNKVYSPDTCLIVPQRINMLFVEKKNKWNFPSGIRMSKSGKYIASYNEVHLGTIDNLEQAIQIHDNAKRIHIRNIAEEYKGSISQKVYDALYNW